MHTSMGLFSSVWTALQGEFSPVFLHIRPIILKSKSSVVDSVQLTDFCVMIGLFWQQYGIWEVAHAPAAL